MLRESTKQINIVNRYNQDSSLLLIDIDFSKRVNDTFGHQVGNIAIQEIPRILSKEVRESDLVFRYVEEEFLILFYNKNTQDAYLLSERIRKEISNLKISDITFPITISVGCTDYRKNESVDDFINRADSLLHKAKDSGRNQTVKAQVSLFQILARIFSTTAFGLDDL